jgi:hypothetical protein
LVKRKTKDSAKDHHHLSDFIEKTFSLGITAKTNLHSNSGSFDHEFSQRSSEEENSQVLESHRDNPLRNVRVMPNCRLCFRSLVKMTNVLASLLKV